ncbi:MAG: hypothetical protein NC321_10470 [Clostridium sp.]|nr:hypothetical protein [Clostridium sp.]
MEYRNQTKWNTLNFIMKMIENSLKEDGLYVKNMKDVFGNKAYMVVDQNDIVQSSEQGMSFLELAEYANFEIQQVSA